MTSRPSTLSPALFGVLVLWGLAVSVVGIHGQFPLSDDWAYAHVVRSLCEGKGFDWLPWTGASLIVQALYGAGTCLATGFSHEVLRSTTLAASVVGIVSFHGLLREVGASVRTAAAGAAVLAFSPLWFSLSLTFMTDVPFAALALLASWLYVRALAVPSRRGLVVASLVAAASFLVRQHGLWIAAAAALAAAWPQPLAAKIEGASSSSDASPSSRIDRNLDAAAALVLPLIVAATYALWAAIGSDVPQAVHNKVGEALTTAPTAIAGAAFRGLATLGFLFVPWALLQRPAPGRPRTAFAAALTGLVAVAAFLFIREGATMFYLTNVMDVDSVGAMTTRDVLFLSRPEGPGDTLSLIGRVLLTGVALASAAALIAGLCRTWVASPSEPPRQGSSRAEVFCVAALLLSGLGTLAQAHYYFDRYVLVLLPLAMAATVPPVSAGLRRSASLTAAACWVALSFYAVAGTHDYMEWNRARWQLLTELEEEGVRARQIDGGVEYNAWRLAAELRTAPTDAQARKGQPASQKSWWWVIDDEWVIAFAPLDGYAEVGSRTFPRWLPPGQGKMLSLRRQPQAQAAASETAPSRAAPGNDTATTPKGLAQP